MNTRLSAPTRPSSRRGFSLIELLVVIGILVIVLAIVLPVLGYARDAARKASTTTIFADLNTASAQFRTDNRRDPGYFSLTDMGSRANGTAGFTAMNNVLLDLCGGITSGRPSDDDDNPIVEVGPTESALVVFDKRLMAASQTAKQPGSGSGGSGGGYFNPGTALVDHNLYAKVKTDRNGARAQKYASNNNMAVPDLVDGWGNAVLAWGIDTSAAPDYASTPPEPFGEVDSSNGTRPFVYWMQNSGFLSATAMVTRSGSGSNQAELSLLGAANNTKIPDNLQALLGNPAYPSPSSADRPAAARGSIVFHSAGSDGVFMSKEDRGGKSAEDGAAAYTSGTGADTMHAFDDVLFSSGQ